jgi:hypothetical protein
MHNKSAFSARIILLSSLAAVLLAFTSGCVSVAISNLTPGTLPENPSEIYTFTLRATPKLNTIIPGTLSPQIVIDGQTFPMKKSSIGEDLYEFDYQLPAGRQEMSYYFIVDYQIESSVKNVYSQSFTELQHTSLVHRYVISLESTRGPIGSSISLVGRGFTPQDVVNFDGTPVRTVYNSPSSLNFFVPAMPAGQNYRVTLTNSEGSSPVGSFRIDPTSVSVSPSALTLKSGETQMLTFTIPTPASMGGTLLDVTTNIPESVIMPEVVIPQGQSSISVPVKGGRDGIGKLFIKGYSNADITVSITVRSH